MFIYKISFLLLTIPLYCILLVESLNQGYLVAFGIFLSVLFINSFIIFSKKFSNVKVFFYFISCSLLFPVGLFIINGEVNIILFFIMWFILLIIFIGRIFIEFNIELIYLVTLVYSIGFNITNVYLDLPSNYRKCFIYTGLLHLICYPSFKKLVLFKPVKKTSKKSKKLKEA